ncbi:MAG: hypothetical protein WAT81_00385 [Candidatus Moraniibacteriota bacterium]
MLKKAVLATVAYYDALECPLTEFEVWKHLIATRDEVSDHVPTLGQVTLSLERLVQEGVISRFRGFVVLPHREIYIAQRICDEKYAVSKIKRAATLIHSLAWIPFVRMISLTGSLSMKRGDQESDWDLFVVLEKGAIWRGRTVLSFILQVIGKRRHGRSIENRACLNHFVTDGSLEVAMRDYFSASEYRFMYSFIGRETERRFELANRWMARLKPTYQPTEISNLWLHPTSRFQTKLQMLLEKMLSAKELERVLARWQKNKIERNPKSRIPGAFIVANDEALIFLPHPKGPVVFERFKERLSIHGLSV